MRRLYGPAVLGLLLVGALAIYAVTRVWASTTLVTPGLPSDRVTVTGQDGAPVLVAFAVVVAAGGLAVVAAGGWFRQLVGIVIAGAGVLAAITAYRVDAAGRPLAKALNASPAFVGRPPQSVDHALWQAVAVALFLLAAVLGMLVLGGSRGWPRMGRRYASPADASTATRSEESAAEDMWKAFDEGRDPSE